MGLFSLWAKTLAYPVLRPWQQIAQAGKETRESLAHAKTARKQSREQARQERERDEQEYLERQANDGVQRYSAAEIRDPRVVKNPRRRFEMLYEVRGWTEESLEQQWAACVGAKRLSIRLGALVFVLLGPMVWLMPMWSLLFMVPGFGCLLACMLGQGLRYALFQSQIEARSLHGVRALLSRPDLFSYLLR